jgi:hypothetical protein
VDSTILITTSFLDADKQSAFGYDSDDSNSARRDDYWLRNVFALCPFDATEAGTPFPAT